MVNTPDDWKTTARIQNPERREFWEKVFGGDTIPILSIIPEIVNVRDHPEARVYWLDLKAISDEQRERLIKALAEKFDWEINAVEQALDYYGVPVLADDVTVSTTDQSLVMNLVLDDVL